MQSRETHSKKNIWILRLLVVLLISVTWYALNTLQTTAQIYRDIASSVETQPRFVSSTDIGGSTVNIPTFAMFKPGNLWALVSKKRPLGAEAGYTLVDIPVAHGDEDLPMKVATDISDELQQIVNAAEADGETLMVSSAYRSLKEQQELYDQFVVKNGETLAKQYVSPVGASEHHTGLSVDFSSLSDECADDSNSCSLSQSGAAWLAENAAAYGFIQRYPQGEQAVTGVAFEPWHFRFIGRPLAKAMSQTNLTFDEVVQKLAPGYAR